MKSTAANPAKTAGRLTGSVGMARAKSSVRDIRSVSRATCENHRPGHSRARAGSRQLNGAQQSLVEGGICPLDLGGDGFIFEWAAEAGSSRKTSADTAIAAKILISHARGPASRQRERRSTWNESRQTSTTRPNAEAAPPAAATDASACAPPPTSLQDLGMGPSIDVQERQNGAHQPRAVAGVSYSIRCLTVHWLPRLFHAYDAAFLPNGRETGGERPSTIGTGKGTGMGSHRNGRQPGL